MSNRIFIALVVLAAGVLAGWYFLKGNSPLSPTAPRADATPTPSGSNLGVPEAATGTGPSGLEKGGIASRTVITYSDTGFSPASVSVKAGTVVSFVNESGGPMWVASDPHPVHTLLSGFDALKGTDKGGTYEFTFAKVGTWTYHNHLKPAVKGTVIVTE